MRCLVTAGLLLAALLTVTPADAQKADPKKGKTAKEYPQEIMGKTLEAWAKEIKDAKDPSVRELAIKTVVQFGPDCRKAAGANLLYVLTKDPDHSVRMTAVAYTPLIGFEEPAQVKLAVGTLIDLARNNQYHTRYEAIQALTYCGNLGSNAVQILIDHCVSDASSWQIRRVSCACLGAVARGQPGPDGQPQGPHWGAVTALIGRASRDPCVEVRREALHSILALTPPVDTQGNLKDLRAALTACKKDPDRGMTIWARVALLRLETDRIKDSNPNMKDLLAYLKEKDATARLETMQALGQLGAEVAGFAAEALIAATEAEADPACKVAGIWALVPMAGVEEKVVPTLTKIKQFAPEESVRMAAENALTAIATGKQKEEVEKKDDKKKDDKKKDAAAPKKN